MKIAIDCVFMQINEWSGISQYWMSILEDLDTYIAASGQTDFEVVLLVRGRPRVLLEKNFSHLTKHYIHWFDYRCCLSDSYELGRICRNLDCVGFISTYYTLAYGVRNLGMAYDWVPEYKNRANTAVDWVHKNLYFNSLEKSFAISHATAKDCALFYPHIEITEQDIFYPIPSEYCIKAPIESEVKQFKYDYDITYPYIVVCGNRADYKNFSIFLQALNLNANVDPGRKVGLGVICTSGEILSELEVSICNAWLEFGIKRISCSAEELAACLAGAKMLLYPSLYEGFGYPVLESLLQGTPVITTGSTSLPEITANVPSHYFKEISGFDPKQCFDAVYHFYTKRLRVDEPARLKLIEEFCQPKSERFIQRVTEVLPTIDPLPVEYHSEYLALDGLLY